MLDSIDDKNEPQLFWDPTADKAFIEGLKSRLKPEINLLEIDANINDPNFFKKSGGSVSGFNIKEQKLNYYR